MPTEQAEATIALIIEAYKQSGMSQEMFGVLLAGIAADFKKGNVHKPETVN